MKKLLPLCAVIVATCLRAGDVDIEALRASAEAGNEDAQIILAGRYYQGDGIKQNFVEAAKWIRRAAEQGQPDAQLMLALHYSKGEGVEKNSVESAKWMRKAAE